MVTAPGFESAEIGFVLDGHGGVRWREPTSDAAARLVLVEKVIASLAAAKLIVPQDLPPASIILDTREFIHRTATGGGKLGLGSSAALTVALAEALRCWWNESGRPQAVGLARLLDLHRSFQGGRGSGIDLAASVTGGVVRYRLTDGGRVPSASPIELPGDLRLAFLWTGRSASTGDFLARLDEGMKSDGGAIAAVLTRLGSLSSAGVADLRAGDTSALIARVSEFGLAMEELGRAAGIPILSDEHLHLRRLAEGLGVSYKPSGAGGGDVGIAFTDDPELAARFSATAANAGFMPLDLRIDPSGVEIESSTFES
jgi:phosphomevalonate kinase